MKKEQVKQELIEVIENQSDERLAQIEVDAITEGYGHYLIKEGYTLQGITLEMMKLFSEVMNEINTRSRKRVLYGIKK